MKVNVNLLKKIISQVDKLSVFLRNITRFSARKEPEKKNIDIITILAEVHDFLRAELKRNRIKLNIINNGSFTLKCDETEMRQIVFNIMLNSVHELKNGGEIFAETSYINNSAQLHLYDTGGGVDDVDLLFFNPFHTTKADGTGLGLAIVKDLIKQNNWKMQAANVEGKGLGIRIIFR